ncbi:uncharacterized protein EAF01_005778 [Botrytis porri]|uniref:uncharacterized protein n=1 Tax=Botrytis porri TaxID=87229 RepID=UPI00190298E8|nr:uncharacterized protein EAF01_005778 [Botrytis porri]KAF7905257.1 hypothetical protein EAF01_005778 [Botrytis porri]
MKRMMMERSAESREEWLARKQIIASRIKGDGLGEVGVKMWKDYRIVDGRGGEGFEGFWGGD